ncbi:hypothetical protein GCT19_01245 [Paraburkholderia sp. CNPSo 3155]|uniref:hypothetical protein n=1 Tax=Paraburkholderia atlantica TaxID=2654982 RepID=UPI00128E62B4|nr:hypothetical protein [Paraburkholderia atlantica]MPW04285.1 hypothetical protein [Paraburkholderia atlantica]
MSLDPLSDGKIIDSWQRDASPWTNAVRAGEIDSRRLVTDQAVLDAVLACDPATVLDLGCGEGWQVPLHPRTGKPASVIFRARATG